MSWIDGIDQGTYAWIDQTIHSFTPDGTNEYVTPEDDEEDEDAEYEWTTKVVYDYSQQMRKTKCLFVPEIADGVSKYGKVVQIYTEDELNTVYHSADEYLNAVKNYGLIYKNQKFSNADNVEDLLSYAADYIKNNYHGAIPTFTVTALDLHLVDEEAQKLTVGRRVNVIYTDPATQQETMRTLTIISAEYDLLNPENSQYKIGIPDVTLNKVYGETSKSGSGGGGSGKSATEEDEHTWFEQLWDDAEEAQNEKMKLLWGMLYKGTKDGNTSFGFGDLLTPNQKTNGTEQFTFGLTPDILKTTTLRGQNGTVEQLKTTNTTTEKTTITHDLKAKNDVVAVNKTRTKDLEATNNADVKNNLTVDKKTKTESLEVGDGAVIKAKTKTKTLEVEENASAANVSASGTVSGATGSFTSLVVGGQSLSPGDIPSSEAITNIAKDVVDALPKVTVTIGETRYRLYGKKLDE